MGPEYLGPSMMSFDLGARGITYSAFYSPNVPAVTFEEQDLEESSVGIVI